jgi:hypothetical protein
MIENSEKQERVGGKTTTMKMKKKDETINANNFLKAGDVQMLYCEGINARVETKQKNS